MSSRASCIHFEMNSTHFMHHEYIKQWNAMGKSKSNKYHSIITIFLALTNKIFDNYNSEL